MVVPVFREVVHRSRQVAVVVGKEPVERLAFGAGLCLGESGLGFEEVCDHRLRAALVAEVLDELDLRERTVGIAPVGCSVLSMNLRSSSGTSAMRSPSRSRQRWIALSMPSARQSTFSSPRVSRSSLSH